MQRCPKCGYRERYDWPTVLWVVSWGIVGLALILSEGYLPRIYRIWVVTVWLVGVLLFSAGTLWKVYRNKMDDLQYSRSQELSKLN